MKIVLCVAILLIFAETEISAEWTAPENSVVHRSSLKILREKDANHNILNVKRHKKENIEVVSFNPLTTKTLKEPLRYKIKNSQGYLLRFRSKSFIDDIKSFLNMNFKPRHEEWIRRKTHLRRIKRPILTKPPRISNLPRIIKPPRITKPFITPYRNPYKIRKPKPIKPLPNLKDQNETTNVNVNVDVNIHITHNSDPYHDRTVWSKNYSPYYHQKISSDNQMMKLKGRNYTLHEGKGQEQYATDDNGDNRPSKGVQVEKVVILELPTDKDFELLSKYNQEQKSAELKKRLERLWKKEYQSKYLPYYDILDELGKEKKKKLKNRNYLK